MEGNGFGKTMDGADECVGPRDDGCGGGCSCSSCGSVGVMVVGRFGGVIVAFDNGGFFFDDGLVVGGVVVIIVVLWMLFGGLEGSRSIFVSTSTAFS